MPNVIAGFVGQGKVAHKTAPGSGVSACGKPVQEPSGWLANTEFSAETIERTVLRVCAACKQYEAVVTVTFQKKG